MNKVNCVLFFTVFIVGCTAQVSDTYDQQSPSQNSSDLIKYYAELALEQCGEGNVHKVTVDGFNCFSEL